MEDWRLKDILQRRSRMRKRRRKWWGRKGKREGKNLWTEVILCER